MLETDEDAGVNIEDIASSNGSGFSNILMNSVIFKDGFVSANVVVSTATADACEDGRCEVVKIRMDFGFVDDNTGTC